MSKKISELDRAVSLNNGDLLALAQVDEEAETGYRSAAAPVSDLAQKLLKEMSFPSDLDTVDKTVFGSINTLQGYLSGPVENKALLITLPNKTTSDKADLSSTDGEKAFITGSNIIDCPDITVGSPVYNPKNLHVPFTVYLSFTVSEDFTQSSTLWSIYVAWKDGVKRYISYNSAANVKTLVATPENPIVEIYARSTNITAGSISNINFTRTEGEDFQPYIGKTVQLPAEDVSLLNGVNNIWSDASDIIVTMEFPDGRITSIEDELENTRDEIEPVMNDFSKFDLPNYYFANSYIQNKIARINALAKSAVGNGDAFVFITDQHWPQNAKRSPALLNYIFQNTHLNLLFNGGDSGEGGSEDYCKLVRQAWNGRSYHLTGNHDYYNSGDNSNLYYMLDMYNNDEIGNPQEHYYYVDNNQAKIRYIVLNSDGPSAYSADQLTWFSSALNVDNGWGIVILVHWMFMVNWANNAISLGSNIAQPFVDVINNYSGNGEIIAVIQGHVHRDRITYTAVNGVPVIITSCDKYVKSESSGNYDIDVTREINTITEQCFDIYIINRDTKTINVVRIGGLARDGIGNNPGDEVEERTVVYN